MQINKYGDSARNTRWEGAYDPQEHSASTADVDFFTSTLQRSTPTTAVTADNGSSTLLGEVSRHLRATESRLTRALKSSTKGVDMDEFKEYPRELSNAVLTSQLLVKSLGKATQCIDKLSNLQ